MLIDFLVGVAFVGVTVLGVLGAYFLMRRILAQRPSEAWGNRVTTVTSLISSLHVLILALVFAQELIVYNSLEPESAREANAIANIYFDAERYGEEARSAIQEPLRLYLNVLLADEWPNLGSTGRLSDIAWSHWDAAYQAILDLAPGNLRRESLRDHMLSDIQLIAELRVEREGHATNSISPMFWFAAIAGVIFIAVGFHVHEPDRHCLMLLSIFGAYTGIVLYFIYAFSNPYSPPAAFEPIAYQRLQERILESMESAEPN